MKYIAILFAVLIVWATAPHIMRQRLTRSQATGEVLKCEILTVRGYEETVIPQVIETFRYRTVWVP